MTNNENAKNHPHVTSDNDGLVTAQVTGIDADLYAHRSTTVPGALIIGVDAPEGQRILFVVNDGDVLDTTVGEPLPGEMSRTADEDTIRCPNMVARMDISTELRNYHAEKNRLVEAAVREFRAGTSAPDIARALSSVFSIDTVTSYLAAIARADSARTALAETSLNVVAAVHVSRISAPGEATAMVGVGADPAEIDDIEALPHRIRTALAPHHLTLTLPRGEDPAEGESIEAAADRLLIEGEPVPIVHAVPRQ